MIKDVHIKLNGIKKSYNKEVLKDINLDIKNYDFYAIVGKSGCGKSTLMNILGLIESYDDGEYLFNEKSVNPKDFAKIRLNYIGFIFQSYNLIPGMTARENINLPLLYNKAEESLNVDILAEKLGISHILESDVNNLSGGEKQRVGIARALLLNPSIIIADEPTGNLDEENTQIVFDILKEQNEMGRAVVVITHNPELAKNAKKTLLLKDGVFNEI